MNTPVIQKRNGERKKTWHEGELLARDYLIRSGYEILIMNWIARGAEIDIIARKDGVFRFIEVKYRKSQAMGEAVEAFDERKRAKFFRAVGLYCLQMGIDFETIKAEFIAIDDTPDGRKIKHFRNVCPPEGK